MVLDANTGQLAIPNWASWPKCYAHRAEGCCFVTAKAQPDDRCSKSLWVKIGLRISGWSNAVRGAVQMGVPDEEDEL
jgi:hypothetical protein